MNKHIATTTTGDVVPAAGARASNNQPIYDRNGRIQCDVSTLPSTSARLALTWPDARGNLTRITSIPP